MSQGQVFAELLKNVKHSVEFSDYERQQEMFGCQIEDMVQAKPPFMSNQMYACAILSDVQVEMQRGYSRYAEQLINRAKYFITDRYTTKEG